MSSIHPTNRSTSARTDASSIGSSSYLSTLQLESDDDSESHSDDLNDTKIYQQMDRRRSFLCHSDLNDIATKKKKKKKKKEEDKQLPVLHEPAPSPCLEHSEVCVLFEATALTDPCSDSNSHSTPASHVEYDSLASNWSMCSVMRDDKN